MSFTLMSFEGLHYLCQILILSISHGSKVMTKVKVFCDRQTGKKLDAPEFHSGGIKVRRDVV